MFIPMIVRISTTRMREGFASRWIWLVVWSLISATVGAGSGNSGATTSRASVRRLDVRETPELEGLAQRARDFANVTYPKIVDLLVEDPSSVPSEFDLIFKKSLARDKTGVTKNTRIFVNTGFFNPDSTKLGPENETNLRLVLVHEMGHVAQQYRGMAPFYWTRAPGYWEEGIADYVRYKLGATNALTCLECAEAYPHYTSGYFCAGAFLVYVDHAYGSNVIRRLNTALRKGSYKEAFFLANTGKELSVLWSEFQKTAAYRPGAEKSYQGQKALGYANGKPPKDLDGRFRKYVLQQPGGTVSLSALDYLKMLHKQGELPGIGVEDPIWIDHGERGRFPFGFPKTSDPASYPASRWIFMYKKGPDPSCYQYLLTRESKEKDWKFKRAWRTLNEAVVQEFAITETSK